MWFSTSSNDKMQYFQTQNKVRENFEKSKCFSMFQYCPFILLFQMLSISFHNIISFFPFTFLLNQTREENDSKIIFFVEETKLAYETGTWRIEHENLKEIHFKVSSQHVQTNQNGFQATKINLSFTALSLYFRILYFFHNFI